MSITTPPPVEMTVEELAARVGAIPLWRVRTDPVPGTATEDDVERIRAIEKRSCELIDGVLVEKAVSEASAMLAVEFITLLNLFVRSHRLGWVFGPDGFFWIADNLLRAPDASFVRKDQRPQGLKTRGYSEGAPALAVEILSPGNTSKEIEQKRADFFAAGTELIWIVSPERKEIEVFTGPGSSRLLGIEDTLDGGSVLPGFSVKVGEIFAAADLNQR